MMPLAKQLTVKELRRFSKDAYKLDMPTPVTDGRASVANGRDGPFDIHYKIYGHGPAKIVWICGQGGTLDDWTEMVQFFGSEDNPYSAGRYTTLFFENRGIGESQGPWSLWTIKAMAEDVKDLLDHVGWTEERSVNVVGHSMGGMIAMELAIAHPTPISSLTLMSTSSHWARDTSVYAALKNFLPVAINTSYDNRLTALKRNLFGTRYLSARPADPDSPFPTNGDAFGFNVLNNYKMEKGGFLQLPAAGRHRVDAKDLRRVAERLGKGKVGIIHGGADRMLPMSGAETMFREFGGGETGVKILLLDGVGHMPMKEGPVEKFLLNVINNSPGE